MRTCIVRDGYVTNIVLGDVIPVLAENEIAVPDPTGFASIGSWYEPSEGIFYSALTGIPPDAPEDLVDMMPYSVSTRQDEEPPTEEPSEESTDEEPLA